MIPYGRQKISQEDINSVIEVLQSDFLTQGPAIPKFENDICEYVGAQYGVAVNSGTSALHIACLALELGEGDYLWTTPITFVASANCGLYCGAKVDFVDIDPVTWGISVDSLREKLVIAKQNKCVPKVLVVVHLCGLPCEMEAIHKLAVEYGFSVIEDACHAIGGRYETEKIGSCKYSDITVFSFHPVKTITTGEGGMAVTNDVELAGKMMLYRSHGITREPEKMTHESEGPWYYQQISLGFNYRMTDLQAALGISQLKMVDQFVAQRHLLADRYDKYLSALALQLPWRAGNRYSGMHLYVVRVDTDQYSRERVFNFLREKDICVNLHYIPVHTQPYYQKLGFSVGSFPQAEKYYKEAITLPLYPDLSESEQDTVIAALHEVLPA